MKPRFELVTVAFAVMASGCLVRVDCDCVDPGVAIRPYGHRVSQITASGPACSDADVQTSDGAAFRPGRDGYRIVPKRPGDCTVRVDLVGEPSVERTFTFYRVEGECCAGTILVQGGDSVWSIPGGGPRGVDGGDAGGADSAAPETGTADSSNEGQVAPRDGGRLDAADASADVAVDAGVAKDATDRDAAASPDGADADAAIDGPSPGDASADATDAPADGGTDSHDAPHGDALYNARR